MSKMQPTEIEPPLSERQILVLWIVLRCHLCKMLFILCSAVVGHCLRLCAIHEMDG